MRLHVILALVGSKNNTLRNIGKRIAVSLNIIATSILFPPIKNGIKSQLHPSLLVPHREREKKNLPFFSSFPPPRF